MSPARKCFFHHGDQITAFSPLHGRKNTNKSWLERKVLNSKLETKTSSPFDKESRQAALFLRFLKRKMATSLILMLALSIYIAKTKTPDTKDQGMNSRKVQKAIIK